jgi:hypothetical protein
MKRRLRYLAALIAALAFFGVIRLAGLVVDREGAREIRANLAAEGGLWACVKDAARDYVECA